MCVLTLIPGVSPEKPRKVGGYDTTVMGLELHRDTTARALCRTALLLFLSFSCIATEVASQSLRGSQASMGRQNRMARQHDFTFIRSSAQVERFVNAGYLVRVRGNRDFELSGVSFPYARPEAKLFLERLSAQYHRGCGEKLIVTSLTRPLSRQPRNSSNLSVHPTGMAIDVRRSWSRACRSWLERVLLQLEGSGVLEATRERYPPHYHMAIYPNQYTRYVTQLTQQARSRAQETGETLLEYRVRSGDSLWAIAQAHDTSVDRLRSENSLRTSRIYAGQVLRVPIRR